MNKKERILPKDTSYSMCGQEFHGILPQRGTDVRVYTSEKILWSMGMWCPWRSWV